MKLDWRYTLTTAFFGFLILAGIFVGSATCAVGMPA